MCELATEGILLLPNTLIMRSLICLVVFACAVQVCLGQNCPTTGVQCDENCKNIVLCADVGVPPTVIRPCAGDTFCGTNGTWYDCVYDHCSNPNAKHKFICLQQGVFPSPYQCGKNFICTEIGASPLLECFCKTDEYYDIPTQTCKVGACPREPVDCLKAGQTGKVETFCYACNDTFDAYVYQCNFAATEASVSPRAGTCGPYTGL